MGVYKPWKSKRLLKELEQRIFVKGAEGDLPRYVSELETFCEGGRTSSRVFIHLTGLYHLRHAAHSSLTGGKPDLERLSLGTMYWLRSQQFYLVAQDRFFAEQQNTSFNFFKAAKAIAMLLSLGWKEQAKTFGRDIIRATELGYYADSIPICRHCANWFFLKLFASWQGIKTNFKSEIYPAPLYDELLCRWQEPDHFQLEGLLLAICDWHTHECFERSSSSDKQKDFGLDPFFGWPIEIHMLFRLREDIGLKNPVLDHPLMQTGLAPYLPKVPVITDDLLDQVTEKACEEYPELRQKLVLV